MASLLISILYFIVFCNYVYVLYKHFHFICIWEEFGVVNQQVCIDPMIDGKGDSLIYALYNY